MRILFSKRIRIQPPDLDPLLWSRRTWTLWNSPAFVEIQNNRAHPSIVHKQPG